MRAPPRSPQAERSGRELAEGGERDAGELIDEADGSLLDVIDNLLNKGVVVTGEVVLGVAGVDLVYLRLQAVLCAADRVDPRARLPEQARLALSPGKPSRGR